MSRIYDIWHIRLSFYSFFFVLRFSVLFFTSPKIVEQIVVSIPE